MSASSIDVQDSSIQWFLHHGVEKVLPEDGTLERALKSGKRLRAYLGIDPTGPTLHLGHLLNLKKLAEWQQLGHEAILLIGDFTAMIGDPTDKLAARKQLTREQVLENCKLYKEQASRVLKFDGSNPAQFKFNSEWLAKMSFADVVELASHFTVQQMLERDMFEKRISDDKPVYLHEFLYPLMQGQDSVAMDVDVEICGNDQTFNALAGRTLMREIRHKDKSVMVDKLLTDPSGKKMGKTEGNMIALTDSPQDMYGKVMSWSDEMILPGFELCTDASVDEIQSMQQKISSGENPMAFKHDLARRIVTWLIGEEAAVFGYEHFSQVHQRGEVPDEIAEFGVDQADTLVSLLVLSGLVASKTDARRQIEQGAVKVDGAVIMDVNFHVTLRPEGVLLQKGKRGFVRIVQK